jgi:N-acetylglucosaminyldiphosphoundecaprenol N-acetyl-beta-D-mannosaminyltransferase
MIGSVEDIVGYKVATLSLNACVADVVEWVMCTHSDVSSKRCAWLACFNPHSYAVSLNDSVFSKALVEADWLIPDGAGVILASKILGGQIRNRVTGSDIFYGVHDALNKIGGQSVFFFGASEKTLFEIRARMAIDFPEISVAGTYSPPFKPNYSPTELEEMINVINAAKPDVLWVGMTAPKQEKWIYENRSRLNVRFAGAIGAVFDFYSGSVRRSHPLFQQLGLEWLPRLVQQPRRLWRRMFVSAPIFLAHVIKARLWSGRRS